MSTISPPSIFVPSTCVSPDYTFELPDEIPEGDRPNPLREIDPETHAHMMDRALEIAEQFKLAIKEIKHTN